ncbi:origin recognition complex subunit 5 C-terminus-domain-containing protein [Dipodascopsis uninucleata]
MSVLSDDALERLAIELPGRQDQLRALNGLISKEAISNSPVIALNGGPGSGKSITCRRFLDMADIGYSWIPCDECISTRILLQRILAALISDTKKIIDYGQACSNLTAFFGQLNYILRERDEEKSHLVILDHIDEVGEPINQLYGALVRSNELLTSDNLSFVLIYSTIEPQVSKSSIYPHIYFKRYTKLECSTILRLADAKTIRRTTEQRNDVLDHLSDQQITALWWSYTPIIVDTFHLLVGSDMHALKSIARRAFESYIEPVVNGKLSVHATGRNTQIAMNLFKKNQHMFTSELLVRNSLFLYVQDDNADHILAKYDMPLYSKYLLCAAYLSSFTRPKNDIKLFSRIRENKRRIRHSAKDDLRANYRTSTPGSFEYERLLAIFQCISPEKIGSILDIQTQFATLSVQRLIVHASVNVNANTSETASKAGTRMAYDMLDSATKWRVNVSWDVIRQIALDIRFPIEDYLTD